MINQTNSATREIGQILAGLDVSDRQACLDFMRQEFSAATKRVLCQKDIYLKALAVECAAKLQHFWFVTSKRQEIEQAMKDIYEESFRAKRDCLIRHNKLVDKIDAEDKFKAIIAAQLAKENGTRIEENAADLRRERASDRDSSSNGVALEFMRRRRFKEHMAAMERNDDNAVIILMSLVLAEGGGVEKAQIYYDSLPLETKGNNPGLLGLLMILESMHAKTVRENAPEHYSVLGVEYGPTLMPPPSPYQQ